MQSLQQMSGQQLQWVQPVKGRLHFLLTTTQNTDELAKLTIVKGAIGIGESADMQWTFKRGGIYHPRVKIFSTQGGTQLGMSKGSPWKFKGLLELDDGNKYQWKKAGKSWLVLTADDRPVVTFTEAARLTVGLLEIAPVHTANLSLLMTFIMYQWAVRFTGNDSVSTGIDAGIGAGISAALGG